MMLSSIGICVALLVLLLTWTILEALSRLFWSPLSTFPGPKLAALTLWYEFYFDVVRGGMYIWEIERLHRIYGPIIRISPYELHICDPRFYDEIYTSSERPRDKYKWQIKSGDSAQAMGFTVSHSLHRQRRQAVESFFSTQSVSKLEHVIHDKIKTLCRRLEDNVVTNAPVNLTSAFLALTMDIIEMYSFGQSSDLLDSPEFAAEWGRTITGIMSKTSLLNHCGWIPSIVRLIPKRVIHKLEPSLAMMDGLKSYITDLIIQLKRNHDEAEASRRLTIFDEILNDERLPAHEKSVSRLTDEATILVIAASETPAKVLALIFVHMLEQPDILKRLRQELINAFLADGSAMPLHRLQQLSYLSAVIKEGLRLHGGIVARSQRVSHRETLHYAGFDIPPNTPLSTSSYFVHRNPELFPSPAKFNPDRWIESNDTKWLERYLVAFGKGTRNCVGKNLGQAELYLTLASLVLQFDFELFDTTLSDVEIGRDCYVMHPAKSSPGVRVRVKRCLLRRQSATILKSYERLPNELQSLIVDIIDSGSLYSWCRVNKHAYLITLRPRYSSVRFGSPEVALSFSSHPAHLKFQSPRYTRKVSLTLFSETTLAGIQSYSAGLACIPEGSLRTLCIKVGHGITFTPEMASILLSHTASVRHLSVYCRTSAWTEALGKIEFQNLEGLAIYTANGIPTSPAHWAHHLTTLFQRGNSKFRFLEVINSTSLTPITGHPDLDFSVVWNDTNKTVFDLGSLIVRKLNLRNAETFVKTFLGKVVVQSLLFKHCFNMNTTLDTIQGIAQGMNALTLLEVVLPNTHMQENPRTLTCLEQFLLTLPTHTLTGLRIEIPAAGRFPRVNALTRHRSIERVVIGVTDDDGRWLSIKPSELGGIIAICTKLRCLGLSLPPVEVCDEFLALLRNGSLSTFLVLGVGEMSPYVNAPAWVQYCPFTLGEEDVAQTAEMIVNCISSCGTSEATVTDLVSEIAIGIHTGAYYCANWTGELLFFLIDRDMFLHQLGRGHRSIQ